MPSNLPARVRFVSSRTASVIATFISVVTLSAILTTEANATELRVRREGFSESQLRKLQDRFQIQAYAVDGKIVNPEIKKVALRSDSKESKAKSADVEMRIKGDPAITEQPEDACDSFYMPPAKYRFWKEMPTVDPCTGRKNTIVVDTEIGVLFLCKDGKTAGDYDVSLGRGGVDKKSLGDGRTPVGTYKLSRPGVSGDGFKTFIPIGYPTAEQKAQGYTGLAVGIHGPHRNFRCAGFLNTVVDWTLGCIAVSSDIFIKEIGRFVVENKVPDVTILPPPEKPEDVKASK